MWFSLNCQKSNSWSGLYPSSIFAIKIVESTKYWTHTHIKIYFLFSSKQMQVMWIFFFTLGYRNVWEFWSNSPDTNTHTHTWSILQWKKSSFWRKKNSIWKKRDLGQTLPLSLVSHMAIWLYGYTAIWLTSVQTPSIVDSQV